MYVRMYVQLCITVEIPDTRSERGGIMSKVAIHIGFLLKHAVHTRKPVTVAPVDLSRPSIQPTV